LSDSEYGKVKFKNLTARERIFFRAYVKGECATNAYLKISPDISRESAAVLGPRMLKRIKKKADFEQLLEAGGLGLDRLALELEKGLNAKTTKFYQDEPLGDFEDNTVQQRARELLADFHGKRRQKVDVEHSGNIEIVPAPAPSEDDG